MNPEKSTKEQVKAELRAKLGHLFNTPQATNLNVTTIVSTAMATVDAPSTPKVAAFFPNEDATAKGVLGIIGGAEDIIVVPDSINMSGQNKAITIKSDQVGTYRGMLRTEALRLPNVDADAVANRVVENTILVKESLMTADDLEMHGTIWHEHGHVRYDATESGRVFAHELDMIHQHRPGDLATWIANTRSLAYLARFASEPGLDTLESLIERILPNDIATYRQLRYNVINKVRVEKQDVVEAKPVVDIGNPIEGTIAEIRETLGLDESVVINLVKGTEVTLANCGWKVEQHFQEVKDQPEYDIYKLRRVR